MGVVALVLFISNAGYMIIGPQCLTRGVPRYVTCVYIAIVPMYIMCVPPFSVHIDTARVAPLNVHIATACAHTHTCVPGSSTTFKSDN